VKQCAVRIGPGIHLIGCAITLPPGRRYRAGIAPALRRHAEILDFPHRSMHITGYRGIMQRDRA
jgi:hypothetical protein